MQNAWLQWWTDTVSLTNQTTFPRLLLALVLGSVIGFERQWRQRSAGLRTNTLVCFGAAAFVDLGSTVGGPSTTNIIAYVISGVGFLGAGAIMKDGGSIKGLNTAATLWCSAAVGACAGAGELLDAVFVTAILILINSVFRPISRLVDRYTLSRSIVDTDVRTVYHISAICPAINETELKAQMMQAIAERPLLLRELRIEDIGNTEDVFIRAEVEADKRDHPGLEELANELRLNDAVSKVEWSEASDESE